MESKICSKCGKEKTIDNFHKDKNAPDGLNYWCKKCKRKNAKQNKKEKLLNKKNKEETKINKEKIECICCGKVKKIDKFYENDLKNSHYKCIKCRKEKSRESTIKRIKRGEI